MNLEAFIIQQIRLLTITYFTFGLQKYKINFTQQK